MKYLMLIGLSLAFSLEASAFDLMKCTGVKNGTIWASFGRSTRSGEATRIFPTELVVFGPNFQGREVLLYDLEKALKNEVTQQGALLRIVFTVTNNGRTQKNLLQLLRPYRSVPNGYQGNWTVSEDGQPDLIDQAFCTIN